MEASYGVGITNRYALFLDEGEDPLEKLAEKPKPKAEKPAEPKQANVKQADTKGKPTQPAAAKKPVPLKESQSNVIKPTEQKSREDGYRSGPGPRPPRGDRGGRYPNNVSREERNNRRNEGTPGNLEPSVGVPTGEGDYRPRTAFRGDRGGFRGRGRARGRGGNQDQRPRREFERQSGSDKSGVKSIEKREGGGSHNWGSVQDEIEGQMEPAPTEEVPEAEGEAPHTEAAEVKEGEEAAPAAPEEEEPKELTLDEWKALRGERKKPAFNIRQAGEGEDNSQWKKTYVLDKKKVDDEEEDEIIDLTAEYPQRAGRQKRLDIDIRFADSRRGGERGRGRGRGRGGEGGYRGGFRGGERPAGAEGGELQREREPREPREPREQREPREPREGNFRGGYRGDRGGERGGFRGRGRGGPRGPAQPLAPKVDDEKDFPALG